MYNNIQNSFTVSLTSDNNLIEQCGIAFAKFQQKLLDLDLSKLSNTIPNFHNTKIRYNQLLKAYKNCCFVERKEQAINLFNLITKRKKYASKNVYKTKNNTLLLRVVHNDTKLNNVVFDKDTKKCVCVIDLDTVMKGIIADDFGDAVRFNCNDASEDETDLTKIKLNKQKFLYFTRGYLSTIKKYVTKQEINSLVDGVFAMTYELCIRFLTDYLDGDKYFNIDCPNSNQNLNRAKCQMALLLDLEKNKHYMQSVVKKFTT